MKSLRKLFMALSLVAGLCVALLPALAVAQEELEEVLVAGEQPGPGLWKVSRDSHVMWILGAHGPLPKDMKWRSKQVEARVAESQEVILPGNIRVETAIGPLRGLTLLPAMLRAARNPHGARLKDVLPPETYEKWQVLKAKYIGKNEGLEKYRPTFAAIRLRDEAVRKSGLGGSIDINDVVSRTARKHKVRIQTLPTVTRTIQIRNPRGALKKARNLEIPDIECFSRMLEWIEPEIQVMKARANAWSTGDLQGLRDIRSSPHVNESCIEMLMNAIQGSDIEDAAEAKKAIDDISRQSEHATLELEQNWLDAAQAALAKNRTTFAVLPIATLLSPDGYAARLRAMGYTVDEP